jgi:DNA-binding transcriptional regulator PaaX
MAKVKSSKRDNVVKALRSRHGASVFKLCALTDWKEHTVRAELSRLRKAGYGLERLHANRVGIAATYRITAEPTPKHAPHKGQP